MEVSSGLRIPVIDSGIKFDFLLIIWYNYIVSRK